MVIKQLMTYNERTCTRKEVCIKFNFKMVAQTSKWRLRTPNLIKFKLAGCCFCRQLIILTSLKLPWLLAAALSERWTHYFYVNFFILNISLVSPMNLEFHRYIPFFLQPFCSYFAWRNPSLVPTNFKSACCW